MPPPADARVEPNGFGITHLSPGSGPTGGGQRLTLVGTRLPSGASVLVGGVPAQVVLDAAPTGITVLTPARAAGPVDVTVYGPRSTDLSGARPSAVLRGAYTYVAPSGSTDPGTDPGAAPTSAPTTPAGSPPSAPPSSAPTTAPTSAPTTAPAPAQTPPAPSATPPAASPSAPGTRDGLRLRLARDIDPVLFGHAACRTSCTALRL